MPIVNINGVKLNYEVAGQGKAVVFLHGMTGSTRDWTNQFSALSPKYRCVALDQRGHGKSAAPSKEKEYSIPIFVEDVFSLLKLLKIEKCCFGGHSIGGMIALQFALGHPDMVAALVLVGTASRDNPKPPGYAQLRQKVDELARSQGMEAAFEYNQTHGRHTSSRQKMLMTSPNGYIYGLKAISEWQPVTPRLSEIKMPTLILCGEKDSGFGEACKILHKGIADSELVIVKGIGHIPHEEAPDFFNETLLKFLDRINW